MTKRLLSPLLIALVIASLPVEARAKVIWIFFKNQSTNCAWITGYKKTFTGWYISPSKPKFVKPGGSFPININSGDNGRVRAEVMPSAVCSGSRIHDLDYDTNINTDNLKLINPAPGRFQIVRGG